MEVYSVGEYALAIMMKSGIDDNHEANHVLLDEFNIQEDVKMQIQLGDCDDFRGFLFVWREEFGGDRETSIWGICETAIANP